MADACLFNLLLYYHNTVSVVVGTHFLEHIVAKQRFSDFSAHKMLNRPVDIFPVLCGKVEVD